MFYIQISLEFSWFFIPLNGVEVFIFFLRTTAFLISFNVPLSLVFFCTLLRHSSTRITTMFDEINQQYLDGKLSVREYLMKAMADHILFFDGAMGTMIQVFQYTLSLSITSVYTFLLYSRKTSSPKRTTEERSSRTGNAMSRATTNSWIWHRYLFQAHFFHMSAAWCHQQDPRTVSRGWKRYYWYKHL